MLLSFAPPTLPILPCVAQPMIVLFFAVSLSTFSLSVRLISPFHYFLNTLCLNSVKLKQTLSSFFPICVAQPAIVFFRALLFSTSSLCARTIFALQYFRTRFVRKREAESLLFSVFWPNIFCVEFGPSYGIFGRVGYVMCICSVLLLAL